jgi:biotin operon repressor
MTYKNEAILPHYNVQIPMEVLLHSEIDTYSLKVFAYMKFRYQFFKLQGNTFHESNTTISEAIGISRSKVIESINKLVNLGFVIRQERHGLGSDKANQTNVYTVMDILTPNGVITKQTKKQAHKEPKKQVPLPQVNTTWFNDDEPF